MLLDVEDFSRILNGRASLAVTAAEAEAVEAWGDVEAEFESVSRQAWSTLLLQAWKVFVLGRVGTGGAKALKAMPGAERVADLLPASDAMLQGSNLYSSPELTLLAWMTAHFTREFGLLAR